MCVNKVIEKCEESWKNLDKGITLRKNSVAKLKRLINSWKILNKDKKKLKSKPNEKRKSLFISQLSLIFDISKKQNGTSIKKNSYRRRKQRIYGI